MFVLNVVLGLLCAVSFCLVGAVAHWPSRADGRMALLDAIAAARLTSKEIYMALGYTQSYWSRIERGEVPLPPLDRLLDKLPPAVWDELHPRMAYVVWQKRTEEKAS